MEILKLIPINLGIKKIITIKNYLITKNVILAYNTLKN